MARRDLRRHKARALLTCVLVALPVLVATVAALYAHNLRYEGEHRGPRDHGWSRRAGVRITPYTKTKVDYYYGEM